MTTAPSPPIFVVDDEEAISATLAAILRGGGFAVTAFTNPLECLAAAFHGQPELLESDVMMQDSRESSSRYRYNRCVPIARFS